MKNSNAFLTYALNKDGKLVHIDCVPNGNDCGCFCPYCKGELCAKNGGDEDKRVHHFAHLNGADCVGAVESALHKMAKDVLMEARCVQLPERFNGEKGEQLIFDRIDVEFYDKETKLRPDCIGYYGDKFLWVEFKKSHAVDAKKKGKIISAHVDCIEIDLNGCELDPIAVRNFITGNSDNRIWIRDTSASGRGNGLQVDDCSVDRHVIRQFAKDESGNMVSLQNDSEIDMLTHNYYCLSCGKELTIDVDRTGVYHFEHIDEDALCDDYLYLRETAKEIVYHKFHNDSRFEIDIPQNCDCEDKTSCKFYNKNSCVSRKEFPYDLKEHGYTDCVKDYMFPELTYKCDVVFLRAGYADDAIVVCVDAGSCHVDVTDIGNRVIEIGIYDEKSLDTLLHEPLKELHPTFLKFKDNGKTVPSHDIGRRIIKFSLFSSGKYHIDEIPCDSLNTRKFTAVIEYVFVSGVSDKQEATQYSLMKCYEQKRRVCLCEICQFLSKYPDHWGVVKSVCKRYKTKGTPHYPLESMPTDCQYFSLNKIVESGLKLNSGYINVIEKVYKEPE